MERKSLFCFFLLAISGSLSAPSYGQSPDQLGYGGKNKDHEAIVTITKFVRDHLALDVQANRNLTERSNNKSNAIAKEILQHVKALNEASTTELGETLNNLKTHIEENLQSIVDQTRDNHEKLEERSKNNEVKISEASTANFNDLLEKVTARLNQHEKMLDTHVAVCANQYNSIGNGKVTYQHTSMENVLLGDKKETKTRVLDPNLGEFTVPNGADGTYQISFTAIIDTRKDVDDNLAPAKFLIAKKQARGAFIPMEATTLTATVGQDGGDKVPASRSVLLDLQAGEKVAVFQKRVGAESTYRVTFCAHLIRPTSPDRWENLPEPAAAVELDDKTTYKDPEQGTFTIDDLTVKLDAPEVEMPVPESDLRFPETPFFKKTPEVVPSAVVTDPFFEDDPNELG